MSAPVVLQSAVQDVIDDRGNGLLMIRSTSIPADAKTGYSKGCLAIDVDAAAGATLYVNEGSRSSADFNAVLVAGGALSGSALTLTGNLTFSTALDIVAPANTAAALEISDGTTKLAAFDSRNTIADVSTLTITASAPTIATAAAAHINSSLRIAAKTITYTGTATVTSSLGAMMHLGIPTFTDASAGTLSLASTLHVSAVAAAGGSLTLSAARMISTGVSDCYLTNAGVWTDTASTETVKNEIADAETDELDRLIDSIRPRSWKYKPEKMGHDFDRTRFGIVAQELPDCLAVPGEEKVAGLSGTVLGSFALAGMARLNDRIKKLEAALAA